MHPILQRLSSGLGWLFSSQTSIGPPRAEEEQQEPHGQLRGVTSEPTPAWTWISARSLANNAGSTSTEETPRYGDGNNNSLEPIHDQFNEMEDNDIQPWLSKYLSRDGWTTLLFKKLDMPSDVFVEGFKFYGTTRLMELPLHAQTLIAD